VGYAWQTAVAPTLYPDHAVRVSDLVIYPIKSCGRGVRVSRAIVTSQGLEGDRQFVVTDTNDNFLSQRSNPAMAMISPCFHEETGDLRVSAPGLEDVVVAQSSFETGQAVQVTVWGDTCEAIDQGDAVAEMLSAFLGSPGIRLRKMKQGFQRSIEPGLPKDEVANRTSFADKYVYPFVIWSLSIRLAYLALISFLYSNISIRALA
jgi:uncharacterized protein